MNCRISKPFVARFRFNIDIRILKELNILEPEQINLELNS